jgi:hypothetical protein
VPGRLAASRTGSGHFTPEAQPSFSNTQITRALMSIWPRSTPCRAQVGSAWCRLCHDSPALRIASGQKLVARSRETKGRSPTTWQTELIDQVTWCSSATRTSPAQKNAVQAPVQLAVTRPPMTAGSARLRKAHRMNSRLVRRSAVSLSRSGA